MNDKRLTPWVVGLNGLPTERVKNSTFEDDSGWVFRPGWDWFNYFARWQPGSGFESLGQIVDSVSGEKWAVFFEVKSSPGDIDLDVYLGGALIGTVTEKGKFYVFTGTAGGDNNYLEFVPIDGIGAKIDNVFAICLDDCPLTGIFFDDAGDPRTNAHSVAGKINTALSFDGIDDYIDLGNSVLLQPAAITVSFWVKRTVSWNNGRQPFFYAKPDGVWNSNGWFLETYDIGGVNRVLEFIVDGANWFYVNIPPDTFFPLNEWVHIIISFDSVSNDKAIYKNNVSQSLTTYGTPDSITATSDTKYIGLLSPTYGNHFSGQMDCVAIFDKILSQAERDMLWHGGKGTERLISLHHHIYRGQDGNIDYGTPEAEMALDDSQITIADQELPANTIWHYIRRQMDDECGLESDDSPACIVVIDSNGDMIGSTPNPPISLTIERLSNGRFRLRWRYTKLSEQVAPTGFKIYMDSGSGFNFSSPDATIAYGIGGINNEFSWISGALTHGQIYRFCVRSYRTGEGESQNTDYVATDADSEGPAAITDLQASYEEI